MKTSLIRTVSIALSILFLSSCSLLGIHFQVHNPKHEGKLPKFSDESILLGELTKYRSCFDVTYYDLSVEVNSDEKELKGAVIVDAIAVEAFDTIQLDLHPDLNILSLVDYKTGSELNYDRVERAVFVAISKKKADKFQIQVKYKGKPVKAKKPPWKGGFVWKKDNQKNPWIGVACESEGASVWWPLKDHTSDEPDSMRLHYTVSKDLVAVGNGQLEGVDENESTKTYNWFVSYPINTYNVSIYVGKFELLKDTYTGINGKPLEINHYVLAENYLKAKEHFKQLHPQLKVFEQRFGEYPWYNDGFKLVESPYAGMEHQTAIAYGNGYKNNTNNTDYIILHETAHEWWGNSITAKDLAHVWLQEGFATYSEAVYFEDAFGKSASTSHLSMYKWFIKNKYPVVGVEGRRWFHFRKGSDVYVKGAWILHTLRNHMGNDSLFFDIIRTFSTENAPKIVESQDFVNLVNSKTGKDFSWFFDHYLYKNEAPSLSYYINEHAVMKYKWTNVDSNFNQLQIVIEFKGQDIIITPTTKLQTIQLPIGIFNFESSVLFELNEDKKISRR